MRPRESSILTLVLSVVFSLTAWAQFEEGGGSSASEGSAQPGEVPEMKMEVSSADLKMLAEARRNKNEREVVAAAARILGADSKRIEALNTLAVFYFEQGQVGLAKIILTRAIKDHPQSAPLRNNLGVVYLSEGKLRQALVEFRRSLDLDGGYRIGAANLGSIMAEFHDYKKALSPLSAGYKAVRSQLKSGQPAAIEVANNYAVALAGVGEFNEAREIYQEILEGSGRNAFVLMNYAVLLIEKLKDYKEGGKIISRIKFAVDDPKLLKRVSHLEKMVDAQTNE